MARDITFDILARDRASKTFDGVGKSSDGLSKKLGGLAKAGGLAAAAAVSAAAIGGVKFGLDAVKSASDLNETINKSSVIFGKNATAIADWAGGASKALGLSKTQALEAASGFGDMFLQLGFANKQAATMSTSVVQMAADLGSFNNLPTAQVTDMITSAFRGEYDSLQRLIPNISAARVESEAMRLGLVKNTVDVRKLSQARESQSLAEKRYAEAVKEHGKGSDEARRAGLTLSKAQDSVAKAARGAKGDISAQAKAQAVLSIVQKDGKRAAGDFAKTSGGLANQQKILKAEFENVKAEVGSKLLPIMTRLGKWFIDDGLPAVRRFGGWITGSLWPALQKGYQTILPGLKTALGIVTGGVNGGSVSWKDLGKVLTDKVIPFLSKLISVYLPVLATNIRTAIEFVKILYGTFTTWRDVVARVVSFIVGKFGDMMDVWAGVLRALGKVPGFGWAKTAADKMQNAADKAHNISRAIAEIPSSKTVTVNVMSRVTSGKISDGHGGHINAGMRADGGPIRAGRPYMVGENGPELVIPRKDGMVIPSELAAQIRGSSVGDRLGGDQNVTVQLVLDGKVIQQSLLKLKRQGGVTLGLA